MSPSETNTNRIQSTGSHRSTTTIRSPRQFQMLASHSEVRKRALLFPTLYPYAPALDKETAVCQRRCKRDPSLAKAGDAAPALSPSLRCPACLRAGLFGRTHAPRRGARRGMRMRRHATARTGMEACVCVRGRARGPARRGRPRCACPARLLPRPRPTPPRRAQRTPSPATPTPRPAAGHGHGPAPCPHHHGFSRRAFLFFSFLPSSPALPAACRAATGATRQRGEYTASWSWGMSLLHAGRSLLGGAAPLFSGGSVILSLVHVYTVYEFASPSMSPSMHGNVQLV